MIWEKRTINFAYEMTQFYISAGKVHKTHIKQKHSPKITNIILVEKYITPTPMVISYSFIIINGSVKKFEAATHFKKGPPHFDYKWLHRVVAYVTFMINVHLYFIIQ